MVGDQSHEGWWWVTQDLGRFPGGWPEALVGDRQIDIPSRESKGIEFI